MIRIGTDFSGDSVATTDVVVIGTGCGGATLGHALAERGHRVTFVERGGYWTAKDFDQREANMLAKIDGGRGLDTSDDGGVSLTYGNNVGGASVHYWADSYRLPADRLAVWERDYGLEGHGAEVLRPHFERLERDLSVTPADDTFVNEMNRRVHAGASALGWKVERVPQARKGCTRSGHCMQGCAVDAKQSQLVTHLATAVENGAEIWADLEAFRLHWEGRRVTGVSCQVLDRATGRPAGPTVRIDAKVVVLAAGGYGTPRILLKQGLRQRLPLVGDMLFVNPCPMVHARFDEPIVMWRNIPAAWGVEEFRLARHDAAGAYVEGGYLLMANQLHPGTLGAVFPGFGAEHRAVMRELPRLGGTICWIDDVERGRMTLVSGGRTRVHVPLTGENALRIRDAWRKQATLLFAAGAREVMFGDVADTRLTDASGIEAAVAGLDLRPARNVLAAPHPGGGARMGRSPADSVVGFDHRVHDSDNLYVSDPSVFPSPPSVDPSLTIMAFAYIAADAVSGALG